MASIQKRGGATRLPYEVRYKVDGKHKSKSFALKKEADKFRAQVETEKHSEKRRPEKDRVTVRAVCEAYLRDAQVRMQDGRIGTGRYNNLRITIDTSIIPLLGERVFDDLSAADVEAFYADMCGKGRLAPMSARDRVSVFKLVEDFAVRRGLSDSPPVVQTALRSLRGITPPRVRTFTKEEMARLVAAVEDRPRTQRRRTFAQMRCAFYLAAQAGLRWGEIYGLTLDNVDAPRRLIRVRHSITNLDDLKGPKTRAGNRDVPIPARVADILADWIEHHYVVNERRLLFRTPTGLFGGAANFHNQLWWPLCKRAGLPMSKGDKPHFHALRHFAASLMIEMSMPLPDVAALLGHSTFDMTLQVYAHPIVGASARRDIVERIDGMFALPPPSTLRPPYDVAHTHL